MAAASSDTAADDIESIEDRIQIHVSSTKEGIGGKTVSFFSFDSFKIVLVLSYWSSIVRWKRAHQRE